MLLTQSAHCTPRLARQLRECELRTNLLEQHVIRFLVVGDFFFRYVLFDRLGDGLADADQVRDSRYEMSNFDGRVWLFARLDTIEPIADMVFDFRAFKRSTQSLGIAREPTTKARHVLDRDGVGIS